MGLGKTYQALHAVADSGLGRVLVVCPSAVKYNWRREAFMHFGASSTVLEGRKPAQGTSPPATPITVINYDILGGWLPWIKAAKFDICLADECQAIKNIDAECTQAMFNLTEYIPHIIAMSGTPATNRVAELWPVLKIIRPDVFGNMRAFMDQYTYPTWTQYGWDYRGAKNLNILNPLLLNTLLLRRRKTLLNLPPKYRHAHLLSMQDPAEYKFAKQDFIGWMRATYGAESEQVKKAQKNKAILKGGYLLRLLAKQKLWHLTQALQHWSTLHPQGKAIVSAIHTPMLDALCRRVPQQGQQYIRIDGSVPAKERLNLVQQFQNDPRCRWAFGQIEAMGVGLTMTAADAVFITELPWAPATLTQLEDRAWRLGRTAPVDVHYMLTGGTVEVPLCTLLQSKQTNVQTVLDGPVNELDLDLTDVVERMIASGKY
jgi:SWI/SNF-related matrix-associated actin-dependent regulator 1 of chromatin subfamily A